MAFILLNLLGSSSTYVPSQAHNVQEMVKFSSSSYLSTFVLDIQTMTIMMINA